jgi:hypothetical protein
MSNPGGLSKIMLKNDDIQKIVNNLKKEIEKKLDKQINKLNVHSYKTQIVAGINYFVKVEIEDNIFIHLKIYKTLNNCSILTNYLYPLNINSPINYF